MINASSHSIVERHLRNYTVKRLIVLQKTIPAAVAFVKQSWKKEGKCFGQRSHVAHGPSASHTEAMLT